MFNEEIKHYGIPGMKWGVRRYQNEDGTLTPLGRRRKGEEIDAVNSHYERANRKHIWHSRRQQPNLRRLPRQINGRTTC